MQTNKTCPIVEQYLGYLVAIKGRSENTVKEISYNLCFLGAYTNLHA